jgi:dihydroneopterin aldolase
MADVVDLLAPRAKGVVALTKVMVRDLTVQADIGVNMDEIGRRQPLIIDVELTIALPEADRLTATIDYRDVVALARGLAETRIELIETFARLLGTACFKYIVVCEAAVTVRKPQALTDAMAMTRVLLHRS